MKGTIGDISVNELNRKFDFTFEQNEEVCVDSINCFSRSKDMTTMITF